MCDITSDADAAPEVMSHAYHHRHDSSLLW